MSKVVAVDVEGVIVPRKTALIIKLAKLLGPKALLKNAARGLMYEAGILSLEKTVTAFYNDLRGVSIAALLRPYSYEAVFQRLLELRRLSSEGYRVILLSSGLPQILVDYLASYAGACAGYGVNLIVDDGKILGVAESPCLKRRGKRSILSRYLRGGGQAIVLADDHNNLQLRDQAGLFIGFNPDSETASKADAVFEADSLKPVVEFITGGNAARTSLSRLLTRKAIHAMGILVLPLYLLYPAFTVALLLLAAAIYAASEVARVYGVEIPIIQRITLLSARGIELEGLATAPILFALALCVALLAPPPYSYLALTTLTVGDAVSGVCNALIRGHRYPHNRLKSFEGSLLGFTAAYAASLLLADPVRAAVSVALGMAAEAVTTRIDDNVPIVLASLSPLLLRF